MNNMIRTGSLIIVLIMACLSAAGCSTSKDGSRAASLAAAALLAGTGTDAGTGGTGNTLGGAAGPIVADHTWCRDVAEIPAEWRERVKERVQLLYIGQSHSTQIGGEHNADPSTNGGLFEVMRRGGGLFDVDRIDTPGTPCRRTPGRLNYRTVLAQASVNSSGYPPSEFFSGSGGSVNWDDFGNFAVERFLDANPDVNVVAFCWCGELAFHASRSAYLDGFFAAADYLENKYDGVNGRKVVFIWMTGHAQFTEAELYEASRCNDGLGLRVAMNNARIRAWARDSGRILFDFADMDVYCPYIGGAVDLSAPWVKDDAHDEHESDPLNIRAGNRYGTTTFDEVSVSGEFETVHIGGWGYYNGTVGHTIMLHTELKAAAFWRLLAVIAGWQVGG